MAIQFWINGMIFSSFLPRLPEIRNNIGLDLPGLGWALTIGSLGGFIGSALCGPLVARLGAARMTIVGALGLIATLPLIGLAGHPLVFMLLLASLHLFDTVADVGMNIIGSALSAVRATPVISRLHGLWSVGTVCGGLAATIAVGLVSIKLQLAIVALLLAAVLAYVGPRLQRFEMESALPSVTSDDHGPHPRDGGGEVSTDGGERRPGSGHVRRRVLFAVLAMATIAMEMTPTDWASVALTDDLSVSGRRAGFGFVAVTAGMVLGRFAGDWLTTRLGSSRLANGATVLSAAGIALVAWGPGFIVAVFGLTLAGLGASVLFPRLYDDAAQAPGKAGTNLGALTAGIRAGAFAVPVTVGALAGSGLTVGNAMALIAIPAALVLLTVRKRFATA